MDNDNVLKDIDYYMELPYTAEAIHSDGGYTVSIPELPGCNGCGDTLEEAIANLHDFKLVWFDDALRKGMEIPEPTTPRGAGVVAKAEIVIPVERYYTINGNPTCAISINDCKVCKFLRVTRMGTGYTCIFDTGEGRRGWPPILDSYDSDYLKPCKDCPIWNTEDMLEEK